MIDVSIIDRICCCLFSYQEGLKQSKAKQEEEDDAEKLLESKIKDEESGKKIKTSR